MRTPAAMIIGMVLAPCGLVLTLTATVAPNWRILSGLINKPMNVQYDQGIWDICQETVTNQNKQCGQTDSAYFGSQVVQVARALTITSLVVTGLGIALASLGVRCWEDVPHYLIAACGGVVILISGVLFLIPVSWYNNQINDLPGSPDMNTDSTKNVGYSLVLGYLGSCMEIIAGFSLMLCFVPPCMKCLKKKEKPTASMYYDKKQVSNKNVNPSQAYNIERGYRKEDHNPNSIYNDSYRHDPGNRIPTPKSYTNPMDVTAGEYPSRHKVPWDSDLM